MLEALLRAMEWAGDDVDDAALIVTEIVQNAVEHGSRGDGEERVQVTFALSETAVDIEVLDPGTGEDPRIALERDVETPVPLDQPRGRGLYLIHRLCVGFERSLGETGGLCIRVRKEVDA
jgi:anti-sigma regulatory factor (Ser/Thr protein kinase)